MISSLLRSIQQVPGHKISYTIVMTLLENKDSIFLKRNVAIFIQGTQLSMLH